MFKEVLTGTRKPVRFSELDSELCVNWMVVVGLQFINQLCADGEVRAATILAVSSKYVQNTITSTNREKLTSS